jgi:MFS family permease
LVVPVLPFALTVRAGVKEEDLQRWTSIFLAVYGAALAVGSPIFGWFADKSTSRRIPLLLGLLALGGATAMLCAGSSLALLVTGRFLQGLSASVVWTVGLALISDTVSKEDMGQVYFLGPVMFYYPKMLMSSRQWVISQQRLVLGL